MSLFIVNFIAYLIWLIATFRREKSISVYAAIIAMFTGIAFCAVMILENGIYAQDFGTVNYNNISWAPYILCFICYYIFFSPLKRIKEIDIDQYDIFSNSTVKKSVKVLTVLYVILLAVRLSELQQGLTTGLAEVYVMRHAEGVIAFEHSLPVKLFISLMNTIDVIAIPCMSFYALIGFEKKYINKFSALLILIVCNLPNIVSGIAKGSRGGIFLNVICFLFFVIVFYNSMSTKMKSTILKVIIGVLILSVSYAWIISVARYEDSSTNPFDGIFRYFGEPFVNLGHLFWDRVIAHPYGERLFDRIVDPFPKDWTRADAYSYWWQYTGVPTFNFKTLFGDFYIEFGWWQSVAIISAIGYSFNRILANLKMNFATLPIAYLYFQICVFSFAGFTKHDMGFIYEMITLYVFVKVLPMFVHKNY